MQLESVVIVYNPNAGSASLSTVNALRDCFAKHCKTELKPTTAAANSARDLAAQAYEDGANLVVAFGGDFTARQVAEAAGQRPWAPYHGGTGNMFAEAFGPKPAPEQYVANILAATSQKLDSIELTYTDINGVSQTARSLVGIGFGDLSDAISDADPKMKKTFGTFAYATGVTWAALTPVSSFFTVVSAEGRKIEKASTVFVLNVLPPARAMLSRGCNASDGLLDVVVITAANPLELAALALDFTAGKPDLSPHFVRMRTASVAITTDKPVRPNLDGDPISATLAVSIRVDKASMNVVVGP